MLNSNKENEAKQNNKIYSFYYTNEFPYSSDD